MDKFTEGYIECAVWSCTNPAGTPLDVMGAELAPETIERMVADCAKFQAENAELLNQVASPEDWKGHDFWLTRNHHGTGFWSRDHIAQPVSEALTKASDAFGECDLYIGDDGRIYAN